EAVEMEERDRFRYGVLHPPPAGVGGDDNFDRSIEIVRDEIGGVLVSVVPDDDLTQGSFIPLQRDDGVVDLGVRVLPLVVGNVEPHPGGELVGVLEEPLAPAPERNELHPLTVEFGEAGVGGEL